MGEPQPHRDDDKIDPDAPRPQIERADWLVGPEDGLAAELMSRPPDVAGAEGVAGAPKLSRPQAPSGEFELPTSRPALPPAGDSPRPTASPAMPTWEHGHSSVPRLRHGAVPAGIPSMQPIPELGRDFPMDDAEERARVNALVAEEQAREAVIAARPHEVVRPNEFEIPDAPVPWWSQVPQLLRSDRRVQLVLLLLVLLFALVAFWPRAEKTISVAHLKEHADRYADTQVRVGGSVGEVFTVGGSCAYTLVQGRDTIVVFSRNRRPKPRQRIIVVGTLSSGTLDGQSRAAIFEAMR